MIDLLYNDLISRGANRRVRMLLGRAYLRENRLEDALEVYLGLLSEDEKDASVLFVLGNLYRLAGSPETASGLFARALLLEPGNPQIERQAALVKAGGGAPERVEESEPLTPAAVARLLTRLNQKSALSAEANGLSARAEIRAAADCLEVYLPERSVAVQGAAEETDQQLMPALIEMNIRHARASGRAEMAEALQSLRIHLTHNTGEAVGKDERHEG